MTLPQPPPEFGQEVKTGPTPRRGDIRRSRSNVRTPEIYNNHPSNHCRIRTGPAQYQGLIQLPVAQSSSFRNPLLGSHLPPPPLNIVLLHRHPNIYAAASHISSPPQIRASEFKMAGTRNYDFLVGTVLRASRRSRVG